MDEHAWLPGFQNPLTIFIGGMDSKNLVNKNNINIFLIYILLQSEFDSRKYIFLNIYKNILFIF